MNFADVTVVLTSCERHDLLERTLRSFTIWNTYRGIKEVIVVEDGTGNPDGICDKYGARLIRTGSRKGQAYAIDLAYSQVSTPYIFHCEDDWEFYRSGFIEESIKVLFSDPSCVCVWLRAWDDTNGHPLSFKSESKSFGVIGINYLGVWHGFTWNPGLRRLSDYFRIGSFSAEYNGNQTLSEAMISEAYHKLGYRSVILDQIGYVRHTGWERHVD